MTNINKMIGPVKYGVELFYNFQAETSTCPIVNPASNYCSLYNQRLLKRFINKKLFNDNVENSVLTNIDKICTKMNYKEKERDAAEKEYFNTIIVEKIIKDSMICDALVYSFSPSGVNVLLNNGLYGLVRFDEHGLSDKKFVFEHDGVQKSLFIGDNIVVSFNYFDVQRNRLIFSYIS
jgi:exoribonuclease R